MCGITSGTATGLGARGFATIGFLAATTGLLAWTIGLAAAAGLRAAFYARFRVDFRAAARLVVRARLVAPARFRPRDVLLAIFFAFLRFAIAHPSDR